MLAREEKNPYDVLGVSKSAGEREIRRAYRRRVVTTHRLGVFGLVDQLKELSRAYEALKDPSRRAAIDTSGGRAGSTSTPRAEPIDGSLGVRSKEAREVQRYSMRIGAEAQRENAPTVKALSNEYDRREAAEQTMRRWRASYRLIIRLIWIAMLGALAFIAAKHFGSRN